MLQPNDIAIICEAGSKDYGIKVIVDEVVSKALLDNVYLVTFPLNSISSHKYWWQLMTPEEFYGNTR